MQSNFWASPKIWLHLVPLQKLLCRHKKQFYWMQIIFLSCTKCLWLLQYVNKLLVRHKRIGPAQNIFGPVKGQDMCIFRFWMLNLKIQSNRMFVYSCCFCCIFQKHSIKAIFFWLGLTPLIGDPPWYCIVSPKLQTNKKLMYLSILNAKSENPIQPPVPSVAYFKSMQSKPSFFGSQLSNESVKGSENFPPSIFCRQRPRSLLFWFGYCATISTLGSKYFCSSLVKVIHLKNSKYCTIETLLHSQTNQKIANFQHSPLITSKMVSICTF